MEELLKSLKIHEGFYPNVYKDHLGFPTVGYGFLVKALTPDELALNQNKLEPMSKEVAEKILVLKVKKLIPKVYAALPWLKSKPNNIKNVIIEMCYQLGLEGVLQFKKTLEHIKNNNLQEAATEMKNSKWYTQTPNRVKDAIKLLLK